MDGNSIKEKAMSSLRYFSSDKDSHFTGALIQNAIENESINFPADWRTCAKQKCIISELSLQSDQNLDWELILWSTSDYSDTDLDLDKIIARISMPMSSAERVAGSGQYYYKNPLEQSIGYVDEDNDGKLHIGLVNRDITDKIAGGTGEVVVRVGACLTL